MAKNRPPHDRGPSQRQLRVGELIRRTLSDVLNQGDIHDPDLNRLSITVSEVRTSPDLKIATAYVTPLGERDHQALVAALNRNAKFIRGRIGRQLNQMKSIPSVRFRDDTSFDNYRKIDELLRSPEVARDLDEDEDHGDEN